MNPFTVNRMIKKAVKKYVSTHSAETAECKCATDFLKCPKNFSRAPIAE